MMPHSIQREPRSQSKQLSPTSQLQQPDTVEGDPTTTTTKKKLFSIKRQPTVNPKMSNSAHHNHNNNNKHPLVIKIF